MKDKNSRGINQKDQISECSRLIIITYCGVSTMLVVLHELISFNPDQSLKYSYAHSVAEETGLERIVT